MLIVEKLYKLSDFTPSPDGNYLHSTIRSTPNFQKLYNALKLLTNMTTKDYTIFLTLLDPIYKSHLLSYENWQNLSWLFDHYIGNKPINELPPNV